ncbi:zinc-finger-containing protein [Gordonibacter sp.]|uniref:zinc-finger-containing protein n=2 Tax=Gordonibacter sp. TaxID=1968902 RepID=UPI002FC6A2B6
MMSAPDLHPTKCNICGSDVVYASNAEVYGREYGNGKCYLCTGCGAYVGTHWPRPREALGILANAQMRKGKMACHELFDAMWRGKNHARSKRTRLYLWLSIQLGIPFEECHFGYFDLPTLRRAYAILRVAEPEKIWKELNGE